jgi:hypothetical protein
VLQTSADLSDGFGDSESDYNLKSLVAVPVSGTDNDHIVCGDAAPHIHCTYFHRSPISVLLQLEDEIISADEFAAISLSTCRGANRTIRLSSCNASSRKHAS